MKHASTEEQMPRGRDSWTSARHLRLHSFTLGLVLVANLAQGGAAVRIPRQIVITGKPATFKEMPEESQANVHRLHRMNPGLKIRYFGDDACMAYIKAHFDHLLEKAFNRAERGAYRGDICRAAVLAREGGFYVDVDLQLETPLLDLVDNSTTFMSVVSMYGGIMNALIGATPKNPVLKETVQAIANWYTGKERLETRLSSKSVNLFNVPKDFLLGLDARSFIPKTGLPMGPVTMLRGLRSVLDKTCPVEVPARRLERCGTDGNFANDVFNTCTGQEVQFNCSNQWIRLYAEDVIKCGGTDSSKECPADRVNHAKDAWPTQFGIFEKTATGRKLVAFSHFAGCKGFGCGSGGDKEVPGTKTKETPITERLLFPGENGELITLGEFIDGTKSLAEEGSGDDLKVVGYPLLEDIPQLIPDLGPPLPLTLQAPFFTRSMDSLLREVPYLHDWWSMLLGPQPIIPGPPRQRKGRRFLHSHRAQA